MDEGKKVTPETAGPAEQFAQFIRGLKLPDVHMDELLAIHKKNVAAFTKTVQTATDGASAVARRQGEILRTSLEQTAAMMRDFAVPGNPEEAVAKQIELVRKGFETAVTNARELAEMVEKSNREAFDIIKRRTSETLEELRKSLLKQEVG